MQTRFTPLHLCGETIIMGWLIFSSPAVAIHQLFTFNNKALREGTRGVISKPQETVTLSSQDTHEGQDPFCSGSVKWKGFPWK